MKVANAAFFVFVLWNAVEANPFYNFHRLLMRKYNPIDIRRSCFYRGVVPFAVVFVGISALIFSTSCCQPEVLFG